MLLMHAHILATYTYVLLTIPTVEGSRNRIKCAIILFIAIIVHSELVFNNIIVCCYYNRIEYQFLIIVIKY